MIYEASIGSLKLYSGNVCGYKNVNVGFKDEYEHILEEALVIGLKFIKKVKYWENWENCEGRRL